MEAGSGGRRYGVEGTSASSACASHSAAAAAVVGVGVVRVAAWTFRMGTDGGGSSAGPAYMGMREGGRSRRHARPRGRRRLCPPPPHPRHFFPSWLTFSALSYAVSDRAPTGSGLAAPRPGERLRNRRSPTTFSASATSSAALGPGRPLAPMRWPMRTARGTTARWRGISRGGESDWRRDLRER